jgi:hypothetical protein
MSRALIGSDVVGLALFPATAVQIEHLECSGWQVDGTFQTGRLSGRFLTTISQPVMSSFIAQLEAMYSSLAGEAKLRGGFDHLPDLNLHLKSERSGGVQVALQINQNGEYLAETGFEIDQSFLPAAISSLRAAFPVQQ